MNITPRMRFVVLTGCTLVALMAGGTAHALEPSAEIVLSPAEPDGLAGWYTSSPTVTIVGEAPPIPGEEGGIDHCEFRLGDDPWLEYVEPFQLADGEWAVAARCVDLAGFVSPEVTKLVRVDSTAPSITFVGGDQEYGPEDLVTIHCHVADETSGVDPDACAELDLESVPAYLLLDVVLEADVADFAGNTENASFALTIVVDEEGIGNLIEQFADDPEAAASLNDKLEAIAGAPNAQALAGVCGAMEHQLNAISGKSLSEDEVVILLQLLEDLC